MIISGETYALAIKRKFYNGIVGFFFFSFIPV